MRVHHEAGTGYTGTAQLDSLHADLPVRTVDSKRLVDSQGSLGIRCRIARINDAEEAHRPLASIRISPWSRTGRGGGESFKPCILSIVNGDPPAPSLAGPLGVAVGRERSRSL